MKVLAPYINGVSIGEDRYIFLDMGQREYNYISGLYRNFEKSKMQRAKLYIFVGSESDITYLRDLMDLIKRNISLTKGKSSGMRVNIYSFDFKHRIRDVLKGYEDLYHFDGADDVLFIYDKNEGRNDRWYLYNNIRVQSHSMIGKYNITIKSSKNDTQVWWS